MQENVEIEEGTLVLLRAAYQAHSEVWNVTRAT